MGDSIVLFIIKRVVLFCVMGDSIVLFIVGRLVLFFVSWVTA